MSTQDDILLAISEFRAETVDRLARLETKVGSIEDLEPRVRALEAKGNRVVGAVAVASLVLSVVGYRIQHLIFRD